MTERPVGNTRWPHSYTGRLVLLASCVLLAGMASVAIGAAGLGPGRALRALGGRGDALARTIVLDLRLPRAAVAALAGGGLALTGAIFQALLRNPLAEPYILGVSGGAATGAALAIAFGFSRYVPGAVPVGAFAGALAAIILVFRIATRAGRGMDTRTLLLAGVVLGAFFNAVIILLLSFTDIQNFRSMVFWMMGSLESATWRLAILLAVYLIPTGLALTSLARPLNLLATGEETAFYLGVRIERVKILAYGLASLVVAAVVALCGVVGFVGLVVPHTLRLLWGSDHRLLLPGSFLAGGAFLLLADTVARTVVAPAELPIGVVTALVGVPVFVALLARRVP